MTNKVQAYPLPDNPEPDDLVCHRVYLPADRGFDRAFFGSIGHLSKWVAWQRDESQSGAAAGRAMKRAIDRTMEEWNIAGCNPVLEEPPYTDTLPDGRSPAAGTIDDMIFVIWDTITVIIDRIGEGATETEIITELVPIWTAKTGEDGTQIITVLVQAAEAATPAERADAADPSTWENFRSNALCEVEDDCPSLFGMSSIWQWYDWLDCAAVKIYDNLDLMATWLTDALNTSAAFLTGTGGGQMVTAAGGGGGTLGFSTGCTFEHIFDFTVDDGGFDAVQFMGITQSTYVAGVGWQSVAANYPTHGNIHRFQIRREFQTRRLGLAEMRFKSGAGATYHFKNFRVGSPETGICPDVIVSTGGFQSIACDFTGDRDLVGTYQEQLPVSAGKITVDQYIVRGVGTDPFI